MEGVSGQGLEGSPCSVRREAGAKGLNGDPP